MITGIIAEYNIFHNGHKYQIDEIRKTSEGIVAVMSGDFVQRGDAAVTDKWTRSSMALRNGVDLVLELPVCYALNAAPNFASGGVGILNALGVADSIAFGSECGNADEIYRTADILENETEEISNKIKKLLAGGMSYPRALSSAYGGTINSDLLSMPNNILGIEYARALIRSGSKMKPVTIKRIAAEHNSNTVSGKFASASQIRKMMRNGNDISSLVPYLPEDLSLYSLSRLDSAVIAKLRLSNANDLRNINEMSEGLENRIISAAFEYSSFSALAEAVKSKRYTLSKIRRILIASLLGFTKDIYSSQPEYIRVLGMNKTGMEILKSAKKVCDLPIITKVSDFKGKSSQFSLDLRASDIFALCSDNPEKRGGSADFKTSPVIL